MKGVLALEVACPTKGVLSAKEVAKPLVILVTGKELFM
jgi:hypothetical protein